MTAAKLITMSPPLIPPAKRCQRLLEELSGLAGMNDEADSWENTAWQYYAQSDIHINAVCRGS